MRKSLFKFASVLLCLAIIFTSAVTVGAVSSDYIYTGISINQVKNPVYDNLSNTEEAGYLFIPEAYNSQIDDFDIELCTTDENQVILNIRDAMVERAASVDIYYENNKLYNNQEDFSALLKNWFEAVLSETENAYEGDYLRYVYSGYGASLNTKYMVGSERYFHHLKINIGYYTNKDQENELDQRLSEIISGFDFDSYATEKEKADKIYEFITENVSYDYENLNNEAHKLKYTAYAALVNGTAVCQGYATLFYRMARECGLETRVVVGTSHDQNHAWNIVKIGNLYYYLDSTWDEGGKTNYYLKGTSTFTQDHTPDEQLLTSEFIQKYPISNSDFNPNEINGLKEGDFEYKVKAGVAYITKYTGNEKHVIFPSTIGGFPVYKLCQFTIDHNNNIEEITFSEGITGMEEASIFGCDNLKKINFPSTFAIEYEKYGDMVLSGFSTVPNHTDNIEEFTLAAGNEKMKLVDGVLYSYDMKTLIMCPAKLNKTTFTVPEGVVTIAPSAFDGCSIIKNIIMPETVRYIGYWAFKNAKSVESAEIPEGCEIIGQFAYGGTKVETIHIPASVKSLMSAALECVLKNITVDPANEIYYMDGPALCAKYPDSDVVAMLDYEVSNPAKSYTVPNNVTYIKQYALADTNLEKITIPDSVTNIEAYAFTSNPNLTHIEIPNSVNEIQRGTFLYCYSLASIIVPSSVTEIEDISVGSDTDQFTIYSEIGSTAQLYANQKGIKFKTIDQFQCSGGHNMKKNEKATEYQYVCQTCGDKSIIHWRTDISNAAYFGKTDKEKYVYTGTPIIPNIKSITEYGRELVEGVDYKIVGYKYNDAPGWGSIVIEGLGDFCGTGELQFMIIEPLPATEKLAAVLYGHDDVKLGWRQVDGADGYLVYYKKSSSSSYIYKGATSNLYYKFADLTDNTSYTFKVFAYYNEDGKRQISNKYKTVKISTLRDLKAPSKATANLYGYDDVALSWSKVSYAKGYYVYYKKSTDTKYTYAGKTTSTSFKKANLSDGVKYTFKIVPYGLSGSKVIPDSSYKTVSIYTLKKTATPTITKYNSSKVRVTWTNIAGESGYQISRSTKKSGTSIVSTVWTTTGKTKVVSAAKGKAYYYKVRSFKKVGSKIIYGPWSTAKFYRLK